jgi:hypothetical protein
MSRDVHCTAKRRKVRARIFKRLWSPGINSKELIPPAYVAWRACTITSYLVPSPHRLFKNSSSAYSVELGLNAVQWTYNQ